MKATKARNIATQQGEFEPTVQRALKAIRAAAKNRELSVKYYNYLSEAAIRYLIEAGYFIQGDWMEDDGYIISW